MQDATLKRRPTRLVNRAMQDATLKRRPTRLVLRLPTKPTLRRTTTRADLINAESQLGRTIFGPIPYGHRREFFHDQNNVWIWHEAWSDYESVAGSLHPVEHPHEYTIRYEVRRTGVYKKVSAGEYHRLEGDELANFRRAAHAYLEIVKKNLYATA